MASLRLPRTGRARPLRRERLVGLQGQGRSARDHRQGPGSTEGEFVDWLTIDSQERSVLRDVKRLRTHPLVPGDVTIYGYVFDVRSGRLIEVPEATAAGRPATTSPVIGRSVARTSWAMGASGGGPVPAIRSGW